MALVVLAAEPRAAISAQEPQMRVLVAEGSQLLLRADADEPLRVRGLGRQERRLKRLKVQLRGGRLHLAGGGVATSLRISSSDPRGIWLGTRRYRGDLRLLVRDGRILAINQLGIETYLPSVVGSEMPSKWPLAALQAQAVAARTYALRQRGSKGDFDVRATVSSQVYKGIESETPSTLEAVATTRSLVLVHGGRLINAVFHSSSGGATEPSGEVWRTQLPYLVSVADHDDHSPVHRWNQRFDALELRRRFQETGGVDQLSVLATSSTGRVRSARIQGPRGSLVLTGRELRQRLGLKSTMVQFSMLQGAGASDGLERRAGPDRAEPAPQLIGLWRDSASGPSVSPSPLPSRSLAQPSLAGSPTPPPAPPPLPELLISAPARVIAPATAPVLEAQGRGFGHGVGMSQWGAHGLALKGADFREILRHYYRGAQIRPYRPSDDPSVAASPPPGPVWRG
ncbi:SpoIID/LytB domain-containing protein [Synechococcus sp. NOUM97013]|uniref:SpoIID/LytB domain-containing protein n=1 Tax=Synechococcus sp. NOUM97013 TaxID=1442555 RepID=UPI001644ABA0|nr:SpoIID/LytB domain-containing protein [Synechococcus sp. NOUM97013]